MFTGIIETTGRLIARTPQGHGARLEILPHRPFDDLVLGESIAVDGVCLTVSAMRGPTFFADCSKASLDKTKLGHIQAGHIFNLERAMAANGRFGGHFVSGHVDESGRVVRKKVYQDRTEISIAFSPAFRPYLVPQGSVSIDGVSLTVTDLRETELDLVLIPHSLQETTLEDLVLGDSVHIEYDFFAKYVVQWLEYQQQGLKADPDQSLLSSLSKHGFL